MEEQATKEAVECLERNSYTAAQLNTYEEYRDVIKSARTYYVDGEAAGEKKGIVKGIVIGREEGIEIGREEGIEIGREEGIEIGMEKGEAVGLAKGQEKMVINCNLNGLSMEIIQSITGLSKEKIEEIINNSTNTN
jgi:flagellar biosynthesis/type III secretory pathway protein FliH